MSFFGGIQGTDLMRLGAGILGGRNLNDGLSRGVQMMLPEMERRKKAAAWKEQVAGLDGIDPKMQQALSMLGPQQGQSLYAQHLFRQAQAEQQPKTQQRPWWAREDGSIDPAMQKMRTLGTAGRPRSNAYENREAAARRAGFAPGTPQWNQAVFGMPPPKTATPARSQPMPGIDSRGHIVPASVPLMDRNIGTRQGQAQARRKAADVPGLVIDNKGRSDSFATRQHEGNAAISGATPKQQKRMMNFWAQQKAWQHVFGKAPAGYYYAPDGALKSLKVSPPSIGQQKTDGRDMLLKTLDGRLDKAEKTLKSAGTAQRSLVLGLDGNTAGRFAMGVMGIEETAQAFTDYEQSVLNIVYSLSGMQTTNKEMERFLKAYMPRSGESNKRLKIKTTQLRAMLSALRSAKSRGLEGEAAQQFAVTEWTKHVPGKRPTGLTGQPRQEVQDEFMRRLRELGNR